MNKIFRRENLALERGDKIIMIILIMNSTMMNKDILKTMSLDEKKKKKRTAQKTCGKLNIKCANP